MVMTRHVDHILQQKAEGAITPQFHVLYDIRIYWDKWLHTGF